MTITLFNHITFLCVIIRSINRASRKRCIIAWERCIYISTCQFPFFLKIRVEDDFIICKRITCSNQHQQAEQ